jgi:hypothetical protein
MEEERLRNLAETSRDAVGLMSWNTPCMRKRTNTGSKGGGGGEFEATTGGGARGTSRKKRVASLPDKPPLLLLILTGCSLLPMVATAEPRPRFPPEQDSPVTRCLTRSRYLCPVAPVVPQAMRSEIAEMTLDLHGLCGKLDDGKRTYFAGDSLTLQVYNELLCLCGVKAMKKSTFVNLKGLTGPTVAQTFRKEVVTRGLRRGDRVIANFGSWYNKHHSSNWRKFSPQMANLATELRGARRRGAKLTWTTTVSQHFCTVGGVYGSKKIAKPKDAEHSNGTVCCNLHAVELAPSRDRFVVETSRLIERLKPSLNVVDFFNETTHLWKAHPGHTSGGDCTHYCTNVGGAVHYMSLLLLRSL